VLDLSVQSAGNGYLWVFLLEPGGRPELIYPDTAGPHPVSAISVGQPFSFPDAYGIRLFAADEPKTEKLLFVVTSSSERVTAERIASRINATVTKARSGEETENWGACELSYQVGSID